MGVGLFFENSHVMIKIIKGDKRWLTSQKKRIKT